MGVAVITKYQNVQGGSNVEYVTSSPFSKAHDIAAFYVKTSYNSQSHAESGGFARATGKQTSIQCDIGRGSSTYNYLLYITFQTDGKRFTINHYADISIDVWLSYAIGF